jgi:2-oxoglutarate ferredoxin oxidoreductase subunit alpha
VHFRDLWPFPADAAREALEDAGRIVVVENNATAQFRRLLRSETCIPVEETVLRYDGRPFSPTDVLAGLKEGG